MVGQRGTEPIGQVIVAVTEELQKESTGKKSLYMPIYIFGVMLDSPSIPMESLLSGNGKVIIVSPLLWLLYSTNADTLQIEKA